MHRLDQLLALNLDLSRRQVSKLLATRRVRDLQETPLVDAKMPVCAPFTLRIDDETKVLLDQAHVLQHKPTGCVTALRDARHPTAYALLEDAPLKRLLRPIGRLDLETSGLLLWTTQGAYVQALTHPKRAVPRCYHVGLHRPYCEVPDDFLLKDGHRPRIDALTSLAPHKVHPALQRHPQSTCFASITLLGGAYHEVRRIFAALGSHVLSLCRVQHGPWALPHDLAPGAFMPIELVPPTTAPTHTGE